MGRDREEVGTSIHCRGVSPETCVMYCVNYILPQCYISSGAATDGEDSHSLTSHTKIRKCHSRIVLVFREYKTLIIKITGLQFAYNSA